MSSDQGKNTKLDSSFVLSFFTSFVYDVETVENLDLKISELS